MYNFKNKNLYSNDILNPDKNQRYYYDFGTGNKIERKEVKKARDAFLEAVNKTSTKPQNQKKDDFLEGFNDPYVERREQERKQKEQERKEMFANIRANADKRTWTLQVTTKAKTYDPFASNVKLVGNDMTEKDYDTFFKGFNSANDKQIWQAPKIQKLSYGTSGGEKAKTSLYSETSPAYSQVNSNSQKDDETLWDKAWDEIKEPWEDRKNLLKELSRIYNDLSPESKSAMKTVLNPFSDFNSREEAGKVLENEIMRIHYGRNQYNINLPENKEQAESLGWERDDVVNCHIFTGPNDKTRLKYVSPYDEKREIIVGSDANWNVISADEDKGTYNYASKDLLLAHFLLDVLPWIAYGNTPEDTTGRQQRLGGFLGVKN